MWSLFRYNQVIEQTQAELQNHSSNQEIAEQQIRPIRVAARRQREFCRRMTKRSIILFRPQIIEL